MSLDNLVFGVYWFIIIIYAVFGYCLLKSREQFGTK